MKSIELRNLESFLIGLLNFFLSFLQTVLLVPLLLKIWGPERYSILLLISAFLGLVKTFDLGHSTYVGNEFNKFFHLNKNEAKIILGSGIRISFVLGLLQIAFFLFITFFNLQKEFIGIKLNDPILLVGVVVMMVYWLIFGCVGSLIVRIILPIGKYKITIYLGLIYKIIELVALFVICYTGLSVGFYFICYGLLSFFYAIFVFYYIKLLMPDFFPWWQKGSWTVSLKNFYKSIALTISGFVEQFNTNNGVFLVVTSTLGIAALPIFTTQKTIGNLFSQVTSLYVNPLTPEIIRFHATKEVYKIDQLNKVSWIINTIVVNLPLILVFPFVGNLFNIWTRGKLVFNQELCACIFITVSVINFARFYIVYLTSINHVKSLMSISIVKSIVLFCSVFILIHFYGWFGLGLSIIFSEFIGSVFVAGFYVNRLIPISLKYAVVSFIPTLILSASCYFIINYSSLQYYILAVSLILVFFVLLFQWKNITSNTKNRFVGLVYQFTKFYPRKKIGYQ